MRHRAWILGAAGIAAVLFSAVSAEAGLFRRQQRRPLQYGAPVYTQPRYVAPAPVGYRGGLFARPHDVPTPTNGYGYGQTAAGYGSAYPAHPLGPGWGRPYAGR